MVFPPGWKPGSTSAKMADVTQLSIKLCHNQKMLAACQDGFSGPCWRHEIAEKI
jgi:hypothetical protein